MYELNNSSILITIVAGIFLAGMIAIFISVAVSNRKGKKDAIASDDIMLNGICLPVAMLAFAGVVVSLAAPQLFNEYNVTGTITKVEDVLVNESFGSVGTEPVVSIEGVDKKFPIHFTDDASIEKIIGKEIKLRCNQGGFDSSDIVECHNLGIQNNTSADQS